ncbi:uncharacterized protein EI90DRAFT_3088276 [Cantharellus anzutake]|uniref:uncharacterized protein n=1 Tax=Cantharellus anzutake TaxID=1750568 RepID=UPI001907E552|nr:uncharacterized protein EI90DRAFT_3088276 [Cantharellus anzutake]KAF8315484.1 hypothetical protein EI90DRAFT_3088276 [Cantharellus anzutake]
MGISWGYIASIALLGVSWVVRSAVFTDQPYIWYFNRLPWNPNPDFDFTSCRQRCGVGLHFYDNSNSTLPFRLFPITILTRVKDLFFRSFLPSQ